MLTDEVMQLFDSVYDFFSVVAVNLKFFFAVVLNQLLGKKVNGTSL
jgi:hypothetical protein